MERDYHTTARCHSRLTEMRGNCLRGDGAIPVFYHAFSITCWVLVYIGVPDDFFYGSLHWPDVTFPPFSSLCTQFYSSLSHGTTDCCWRRRIFAMGKFRSFCALLTLCEFVMCCYTSQGIGRKLIGIQLSGVFASNCSLYTARLLCCTGLHYLVFPALIKKNEWPAPIFFFCKSYWSFAVYMYSHGA